MAKLYESFIAAILVVALAISIIAMVIWNIITSWERKIALVGGESMDILNQGISFLSGMITADKTKVGESLHSMVQTWNIVTRQFQK